MTLKEIIFARADEVNAIAARYGASHLRLFGSAARGEERADSDIDLLAEFDAGKSYFDLVDMEHDLEALLGRKIDIFTPRSLGEHIRPYVMENLVELPVHAETR